ncbi:MAG: phosphoribosylformylglycinamidine synthase [Lachnospiraceae bacterium]|nr:phosphoribosylformylglycinamidine synthase [Lachnospiraceae bacterium]
MGNLKRVYVEKKPEFAIKAKELLKECKGYLGLSKVSGIRVLIRYDVEGISDETYTKSLKTVFCEQPVDVFFEEEFDNKGGRVFSVEFLPGQFDQRADSAEQCVKLLNENESPVIRTATTYVIYGDISDAEFESIKHHCINPVDSREAGEAKPESLAIPFEEPEDVKIFDGFKDMPENDLKALYDSLGLAMTFKDFLHIQNYFKGEENRDPSMTEIRVLDTYWSDHCRHTTFSTELCNVTFPEGFYKLPIVKTFEDYKLTFDELYKGREDKFVCLMDLATMAARKLKKMGMLEDQEESDEINACSIVVPVEVDGKTEEWLINFKNETHNHPTEIEPFGGAATCLGGAIRDPLSGRTYVYQAMRVTGAADPTKSMEETLKGKLPQKKIVREAAAGYSSYGNQIGLATGLVKEVYHPGYVAKRMEIGAVMGAAPRRAVQRLTSDPGDIIILLGGRTGRDGCGGATGSSKVHTVESTTTCGAEVQKGNPPTERKIQRLFRREEVSYIIKKCNDFGAGGVSVAIGELADGLVVDLDKVPKKYAGLDGTELAISESQERMAVVVDPKDVDKFLGYAAEENLEAVAVAVVTEEKRLVLNWRGKEIVNLSRAFLDTNGAHQECNVEVELPEETDFFGEIQNEDAAKAVEAKDAKAAVKAVLSDLNVCSQKGLVERFDGSIGAASVFMPFGGLNQLTETQTMIAKIPTMGKCDTVTMMSYGFDPYLSSWSPYHGAIYANLESMSKIVASGGDYKKIRLTYQEYFRRMTEDPKRWSHPFTALLGAFDVQMGMGLPSIGGKDSMSGTFEDIDVPPTLVSFAVDVAKEKDVITPELKAAGNKLVSISLIKDQFNLVDYEDVKSLYETVASFIAQGKVKSAYVPDGKGVIAAVLKMSFGNKIGVKFNELDSDLFTPDFGGFVLEMDATDAKLICDSIEKNFCAASKIVGETIDEAAVIIGTEKIDLEDAIADWKAPLEKVFPTVAVPGKDAVEIKEFHADSVYVCKNKVATPKVFIPVFPGTNCEYDSAKAFIKAGAEPIVKVFKNLDAQGIRDSVDEFTKAINESQIIMFPGGFSAGDEPEGSAKFFATAFRNEKMKEAVMDLLNKRDGLALGICNGFQALIKLGLVPLGEIHHQKNDAPTLTYNTIGRHISKMVYTKVMTDKSPWLKNAGLGQVYTTPASHGEGRFVANDEWIKKLIENGQVATCYCDPDGNISMDEEWNVNGSYSAIEGITSPDGRILGKMAHVERIGEGVAKNIYGEQDLGIFAAGVEYFK